MIVYEQDSLTIAATTQPDPVCIGLLQRADYGTNGIRYRQTGQEVKIHDLEKPMFFQLYERHELIGMYCLDERTLVMTETDAVTGFYGRYLAVEKQYAGRGYGHALKRQAIRYASATTPKPHLFYSYIEAKNTRSLRISEREGFASVSMLATYIFRRYAPKRDNRFARLDKAELAGMSAKLSSYYIQHSYRTFAGIGYQDNYFVLEERGEIVAGIQANPVRWQFAQMPGIGGWITMNLLPQLSATKRFFNPENYSFLALEGLYLNAPRADLLFALLESVLAHFGMHSALWLLDQKDPANQLLGQTGAGWLSGYQQNVTTHVMAKAVDVPPAVYHTRNPLYVSSFDYA
jgi:RimJ/RimL family protein N-acetyltransferase